MGCSVNHAGLSTTGITPVMVGGGGVGGTGGPGGMGGTAATGGTVATGGLGATGGVGAIGGAGATGGVGEIGGTSGTDGAGADGGAGAIGGAGVDGTGGVAGTGMGGVGGGQGGAGGSDHQGGRGGSNHVPDCSSFPSASSFVTPTDGLLHCYWTHSEQLDWSSSESACEGQGGTLVTILSSAENDFVLALLTQRGLFLGQGIALGASDGKASNDTSGPGKYAWVTGEAWDYTNWHSSTVGGVAAQPDGSCTSSCGTVTNCGCDHRAAITNDGTWYDRPAGLARAFACEAKAR